MKYRTKLLVLLVAMMIVTAGAIVGALCWYVNRLIHDQIRSQVLTVAATAAAFLNGEL